MQVDSINLGTSIIFILVPRCSIDVEKANKPTKYY